MLPIACAVLMPLAASAQPAPPAPPPPQPGTVAAAPGHSVAAPGVLRASRILGRGVRNEAGEDIGTVKDLIIHPGGTVFAIIGVGGFLGAGERLVALPVDTLQGNDAEAGLLLPSVTQQSVKDLPEFKFPTRPAPKEPAAKDTSDSAPQELKPAPPQ